VYVNKVVRRIFVTKKDEVKGEWRNLHNEELHNLYPLPTIIRMVKSRRVDGRSMQHELVVSEGGGEQI
jgi:hypothetical protein